LLYFGGDRKVEGGEDRVIVLAQMVEVSRKVQSSRGCFGGVILVGKLVGARAPLRRELSS
jgi:hypothetical protein